VPQRKYQERRAENSVKTKESEEKVITLKEMLALRYYTMTQFQLKDVLLERPKSVQIEPPKPFSLG